ncbi:MAG: bifunctional phosphopantothenoylcysteine decarboxylase/phosphopantothenate--cysteine ligase CoaBC [Bacillaceae bacterium]|nr:bifunctional phosphopantothenoylcysteine decarboxylase/phosphopantothenate--cysteine ligase CoaBC [Bacillaceae bacterium]
MLEGKKILLCVTGGVAVYKACTLVSKLSQLGATVRVVMTESSRKFVTPLTFQALSRQPVYVDTFEENDPQIITHIDVADWADVVLVAPATANLIGKAANGIADDIVSTMLLATTAPVVIAPAMNVHMYEHQAVVRNIETLKNMGYHFLEPGEGYLACGYIGKGRLMEPEAIIENLQSFFKKKTSLKGKKVLVTAGPTQETLDPVRFYTNHSSGKMGYAIAAEAEQRGAEVVLISGPTNIEPPKGVEVIRVSSAQQMYEAVIQVFDKADIVIKSAAVADYRPKEIFHEKLKKQTGNIVVEMERTIDILRTLGEVKVNQFLVGFAAETNNVIEHAKEKLVKKNLDLIVANDLSKEGSGFKGDTNIVSLIRKDGTIAQLPIMKKSEVAKELFDEIEKMVVGNCYDC